MYAASRQGNILVVLCLEGDAKVHQSANPHHLRIHRSGSTALFPNHVWLQLPPTL
jgi:hypothetical protein